MKPFVHCEVTQSGCRSKMLETMFLLAHCPSTTATFPEYEIESSEYKLAIKHFLSAYQFQSTLTL